MTRDRKVKSPWRPPTRRAFVSLIGAAAAALAAKRAGLLPIDAPGDVPVDVEPPRSTWTGKTRWVGHC